MTVQALFSGKAALQKNLGGWTTYEGPGSIFSMVSRQNWLSKKRLASPPHFLPFSISCLSTPFNLSLPFLLCQGIPGRIRKKLDAGHQTWAGCIQDKCLNLSVFSLPILVSIFIHYESIFSLILQLFLNSENLSSLPALFFFKNQDGLRFSKSLSSPCYL